ncbi:hypothetical protein GCM10010515_00940 [Streptomyces fructofermentans]|uniref:Uncharacterized protein n=1 Tax=Streptomyces fructofermentans TaxID=152141 RepID=A0A918K1S0_9ACTN|nr:hypothetical protein GCM10010515_00940 [Streptomyces fructofermentans]
MGEVGTVTVRDAGHTEDREVRKCAEDAAEAAGAAEAEHGEQAAGADETDDGAGEADDGAGEADAGRVVGTRPDRAVSTGVPQRPGPAATR